MHMPQPSTLAGDDHDDIHGVFKRPHPYVIPIVSLVKANSQNAAACVSLSTSQCQRPYQPFGGWLPFAPGGLGV